MALSINTTKWRSPNHSSRGGTAIDAIVLHTGEGTLASDLAELTNDRRPYTQRVSAHYYVARSGQIFHLVDDAKEAWHAGVCSYLGRTDWNIASIGIEHEHRNGQDWPEVQLAASAALCRHLIARYRIPQPNVVAHRWICMPQTRKADPTDLPDARLRVWIADLYRTTAAVDLPTSLGVDPAFAAAWLKSGGIWQPNQLTPGYPVGIATAEGGQRLQRFERGAARQKTDGTVEWLLASELAAA